MASVLALLPFTAGRAEEEGLPKLTAETAQVMRKGIAFLQSQTSIPDEEIPLVVLALIKCDHSLNPRKKGKNTDPFVKQLVAKYATRCSGEYAPAKGKDTGFDNYEAGCAMMMFGAYDPVGYRAEMETIYKYLLAKQTEAGSWHYSGRGATSGDTSMTQYGLLGLWDAAEHGFEVDLKVWDTAMAWAAKCQAPNGGFEYHGDSANRTTNEKVTMSMGAAGACCVLIARFKLPIKMLEKKSRKAWREFDLLTRVKEEKEEEKQPYEFKTTPDMLQNVVNGCDRWVASSLKFAKTKAEMFPHYYYYLYAIERYAALQKKNEIGGRNWYNEGAASLKALQNENGSWDQEYGNVVNTTWALLFLSRSTQQFIQTVEQKFGPGNMLGGEGLPSPGNLPTGLDRLAQRMELFQPSAVSDMMKALDDKDSPLGKILSEKKAEETITPEELFKKSQGDKKMLRALAVHPTASVRQLGLKALVQSNDYRVCPILIDSLSDEDPTVYRIALQGLQAISRKADSFGLPAKDPTAEQVAEGKSKWGEWFASLRIEIEAEQEFDMPTRASAAKTAPKVVPTTPPAPSAEKDKAAKTGG